MSETEASMDSPGDPGESINLDGLIARYGRVIAQAELQAEVAEQRAARLQARVDVLQDALDRLTTQMEGEADDATP